MADKRFKIGPLALTSTLTTNIFNGPAQAAAGVNCVAQDIFCYIRKIRLVNKTSSAATVSLYLGATGANAAGTELITAYSIPANDFRDLFYADLRLAAADFLVGGASANTTITFEAEGVMAIGG